MGAMVIGRTLRPFSKSLVVALGQSTIGAACGDPVPASLTDCNLFHYDENMADKTASEQLRTDN
jgi:hypothetical protein